MIREKEKERQVKGLESVGVLKKMIDLNKEPFRSQ